MASLMGCYETLYWCHECFNSKTCMWFLQLLFEVFLWEWESLPVPVFSTCAYFWSYLLSSSSAWTYTSNWAAGYLKRCFSHIFVLSLIRFDESFVIWFVKLKLVNKKTRAMAEMYLHKFALTRLQRWMCTGFGILTSISWPSLTWLKVL